MNCLTDQACLMGSLFDVVYHALFAIDFAGAAWFGDEWQAITPVFETNANKLARLADLLFGTDVPGCGRFVLSGGRHA